MGFLVLCSNLKVDLKIIVKIDKGYYDTRFWFQFLRTLLIAHIGVLMEYPWLNHKYKIYHIAVEISHKTPGQECSQTSRKNFKSHQDSIFHLYFFLYECSILLSQYKPICTLKSASSLKLLQIKYVLNEKCTQQQLQATSCNITTSDILYLQI